METALCYIVSPTLSHCVFPAQAARTVYEQASVKTTRFVFFVLIVSLVGFESCWQLGDPLLLQLSACCVYLLPAHLSLLLSLSRFSGQAIRGRLGLG